MGNLTSNVKQNIIEELKKGNMEILKDLSPLESLNYGLALQNEAGDVKDASPINDKELGEAMLNRIKDTGIKEQIIKDMEQDK
jgi:hypothetical protein